MGRTPDDNPEAMKRRAEPWILDAVATAMASRKLQQATADPDVMLFTDRLDDSKGVGTLRRSLIGGVLTWNRDYLDLRSFGRIPRWVEGRPSQVFGVSNANSIVYVPGNAYKEFLDLKTGKMIPLLGNHPAYAFISGYGNFTAQCEVLD
jgi:hypothetical protein